MKKLVLIFIFFISFSVSAQEFSSDMWHEGKLILLSEDTIEGKVKYDFPNNLVQIDVEGQILVFTSRKVLYFEIYDKTVENYRTFYALPYQVKPNYKAPVLFEVLLEGPLTLLSREVVIQESVPVTSYYYGAPEYYSRYRLDYEFYFLHPNGKIEQYYLKKQDLYLIMRKKSQDVKQYMKKNKLRYDRKDDLIQITGFYNSLLKKT